MDFNKLAKTITNAGIILVENGAEIYRVEDTMNRIALAYGAKVVDSYATPTLLLVSFSLGNSTSLYHNIKRVHMKSTNLAKIDAVNSLSRSIVSSNMSLEELDEKLEEINHMKPYSEYTILLGAAICVFGFTFFFGGNIKDAIIATIIGTIIKYITIYLDKIELSSFFINLLSGFMLTLLAILTQNIFSTNIHTVTISAMMLLVPGLAITNAIRDSVSGDLVSGLTRGMEAIFVAIAIAVGSGICYSIFGGLL